MNEDTSPHTHKIRRYEPGRILINNDWYTEPVIIMPNKLISPWPCASYSALSIEDFDILKNESIDILLLGSGDKFELSSPKLLALMGQRRIALETMDTRAACRTYLILTAEDRRVAAALFP